MIVEHPRDIIRLFKQLLAAKGLSAADIAQRTELTEEEVAAWLDEAGYPDLEAAMRVAHVLDYRVNIVATPRSPWTRGRMCAPDDDSMWMPPAA